MAKRLPDRPPRLRLIAAVVAASLGWAASSPRPSPEPQSHAQLLEWARGPVRWLLQPAELRELKRTRSAAGAVNFVERFWARRDPEPGQPDNRFRALFSERVEAADLLYAEPGVRGSLTDRGRAMVLLGAPDELRITSRDALEWDSRGSRMRRGRVVMRVLPMEVWSYRLEALPEVLAQTLGPHAEESRIQLSFYFDGKRTRLSRGEEILDLVSRVALARPF